MSSDIEVRAAQQQVRETLIGTGLRLAARLRELKETGHNPMVAMSVSGGLALIFVKGTKEQGPHLRFGAPDSKQIAKVSTEEANQWNRQHPNHSVERVPLQYALEREGMRLFTLLLELENSIKRTEG